MTHAKAQRARRIKQPEVTVTFGSDSHLRRKDEMSTLPKLAEQEQENE
jgi:hypothetical protein